MTQEPVNCPICRNRDHIDCIGWYLGQDTYQFECDSCGKFALVGTAKAILEGWEAEPEDLRRSLLAYRVQQSGAYGSALPILNSDDVKAALDEKPVLPSPHEQASNIIKLVGDHVRETGDDLVEMPGTLAAMVGAPSRNAALRIATELVNRGVLAGIETASYDSPYDVQHLNLSLDGWAAYDAERRGNIAGSFGFLAMKFNDPVLEVFARDVIKPAVESVGFVLVDIRDTAKAGIIDNLLRAQSGHKRHSQSRNY